jgi:hypothetical protein
MTGGVETGIFTILGGADGDASVASRLGLASKDEIDSVCEIDPSVQGAAYSMLYGTPTGQATLNTGLSAGVYRDDIQGGGASPTLTLTVAGLPGAAHPLYDAVVAFALIEGFTEPLQVFWAPVGFSGGDTFELPLSTPFLAAAWMLEVGFFWAAYDVDGSGLKVSSPIVTIEF